MHKDRLIKVCGWTAIALLAIPLLLRLSILLASPGGRLADVVEFIYDDGYYYLGLAANFADTGRSSLDGISMTNGYQPLWLLALAALAKLVGTASWRFFVASCAFIYAIAVAGPLIAMVRSRNGPWGCATTCIAIGLCVVMIQQPAIFLQGLEPILFALIVVPLILAIERYGENGDWLLLSTLLAVAFLVRLDALALYFSAVLVLGMSGQQGARASARFSALVAAALRLSTIVVPTVAVYMLINQYYFGSPIPVSGLAKQIGAAKFSNWGVAWMFFDHWHSLAFLVIIVLPLEWLAHRVNPPSRLFYRSLAIVCIAACVQCLYYCSLSAWIIWPWYSYLVAIAMALIIGRIIYLAALLSTPSRVRFAGLLAIALVGAWYCARGLDFVLHSLPPKSPSQEMTFNQASLDMVSSFFAPSRKPTLIAMGDRAGGLAYWGRDRLAVVQMEGLTLDMGYIRARNLNRGAAYVEEHFPVEYLVIDRENVPQVAAEGGETQYVIAEPIQGRVTTGPVPTFCFPESAVRYRRAYRAIWGTYSRLAFEFKDRAACSSAALELIRSVEQGVGLRQFSLPTEYNPAAGGTMNKEREDADRARARRLSGG
ncbi:MAG TPA: hypothetical protein VHS76_11985 [Steroidobacteraceae bacterium]|nr:hypothetical protein [Steroidobacteraceae bacterium]